MKELVLNRYDELIRRNLLLETKLTQAGNLRVGEGEYRIKVVKILCSDLDDCAKVKAIGEIK